MATGNVNKGWPPKIMVRGSPPCPVYQTLLISMP
jgi:hypothetical protein